MFESSLKLDPRTGSSRGFLPRGGRVDRRERDQSVRRRDVMDMSDGLILAPPTPPPLYPHLARPCPEPTPVLERRRDSYHMTSSNGGKHVLLSEISCCD